MYEGFAFDQSKRGKEIRRFHEKAGLVTTLAICGTIAVTGLAAYLYESKRDSDEKARQNHVACPSCCRYK